MIELAVVVKNATLLALGEHSANKLGGVLPINNSESLVLFTADTLRNLLDCARPEDARIDDVILRLVV